MVKIFQEIHEFITNAMANCPFVEDYLIAKVYEKDKNGEIVTYDCIYCTILRVAMIFLVLGLVLGYFLCRLI